MDFKTAKENKTGPVSGTIEPQISLQDQRSDDEGGSNVIRFADIFAGIGGFRIAMNNVCAENNIPHQCVFSCEIDKYAQRTYQANFNEVPTADVTKVSPQDIPDHDILFAGFPCQPFSGIGKQKGFSDPRGTLFFNILEILKAKRPFAFLLENVNRLVTIDEGRPFRIILRRLRSLGYNIHYQVLNALDFGLPQRRKRIFIVGFRKPVFFPWPDKKIVRVPLSSILQKRVRKDYYLSAEKKKDRKSKHKAKCRPSIWHESISGHISSNAYSCALRATASSNYLLVNGVRRLIPREMLRLQGFPDSFRIVVSDNQVKKQAGNAIPINVVQAILESVIPIVRAGLGEINGDIANVPTQSYSLAA